ncbi:50S ribosomal protein L11 methyltransferase [Patulibacter brassicae]|jgi:ribosomal protein L11 methyltransferase|uniref:50S ribosomal protein L11 methyltransferase n=1 Tax=Patulibacter brassicae TaxID=1705717 RepID=A0ABU4VFL0_9ACTN|nr:50S ribosomal protein L11 methyltransferase [Patulibacter brassicae]MDX8150621.1 50S ribosomal protein L11 methyltransferase [Patulibacter brassicae]
MIRLALRVRREDAEVVLAELADLAPSGVEERDLGATIEYAVYGAPGELPTLPAVEAAIGGALVEVVSEEVADDWADRWRAFHQPVLVAGRLHVRPPWSPPRDEAGVRELVVDPGRAFGTGGHGTTRLCLELLVGLEADGVRGRVLDLGCGSGVLAIAAAQLGWAPVLGVDHEEASVAATRENAAVNGVTVAAERFDLLRDGAACAPAGDGPLLVLANLLRPLLLRVAADGFREADGAPATPDALIASGLLVHEADEVAAAFGRLGLVEADRRDDGEWAALLLRRPVA